MLLSCLQIGLSLTDVYGLKIGTILDILIEYQNTMNKERKQESDDVREATSKDNIMDFF